MRKVFLAAVASAALASPASAATVYSNNFNAENGGNTALNYNSFNGLTVTGGTVDLVKSGDFSINCAGGTGACVDLDGSTNNSGLASSSSFAFGAGDRVALSFLFSGNQRQLPNDAFRIQFDFSAPVSGVWGRESTTFGSAVFGNFSNAIGLFRDLSNIPPGFAMTDYTLYFIADNAGTTTFSFQDAGNDNIGIVIDNVSLDIGAAVPEPSAWAMMILGFGALGAAARRRRAASMAVA